MAHALHKGCLLVMPESFPVSPMLQRNAASVYKQCYPDQFKLFKKKWPTKVTDQATLPMFRHKLCHDAETSYGGIFPWTVWWEIIAKIALYAPKDIFRCDFVHPEYQGILPSMTALIKIDYPCPKEEKDKHPEYLHDAITPASKILVK